MLLAGCSSTSAPPPSSQAKDLLFEEANDPKFEQGPGGFLILWNFSATWQPAHPSGPINATLVVKLYGREPAGDGAHDTSFAESGEKQILHVRTAFLGIGDYRYNLTARDANGTLVGARTGLFETCLC